MSKSGTLSKQLIVVGMVLVLMLVVYSVTSTINIVAENDPEVCSETSFSIENICFSNDRTSFNNFHNTVKIQIQNKETDINGFTVKIFGQKNIESAVLFKTVQSHEQKLISVAYEKEIAGEIRKVEIKPMLNLNQNIYYCSLQHGTIYDGEIPLC